ncbi:MAG: hypothetical protein WBF13_10815 [Candidatus Zixiibacteriota bacterium]
MVTEPADRRIWQIGGGTAGKSCAEAFLKYGVGLIGPGDFGQWPGAYPKNRSTSHISQFAEKASPGDIIILRQARSAIRAVGIIASDYEYMPQFEDVDGWDLQHARRVRWFPLPELYHFKTAVFGANPTRFSGVDVAEVVNYARRFIQSPPLDWQSAKLPDLPPQEAELDPVPPEIASIVASAGDIVPLYWKPEQFGQWPTEDELVGHYAIPLFRALGWPIEHIAVKWRHVDIALFDRLPRKPENCRLIIEAKRFDTGFEHALKQARGYLKDLQIMRDVMVTDGIRYRLYAHEKSFAPVAYANLARLKQSASHLFDRLRRS